MDAVNPKLKALGYASPDDIWQKPKIRPMPVVPADSLVSTFARVVFWHAAGKVCEFRVGPVASVQVRL